MLKLEKLEVILLIAAKWMTNLYSSLFLLCCSGGKKRDTRTAQNGGSSSIKVPCSLLHMNDFRNMLGFIMMVSTEWCVFAPNSMYHVLYSSCINTFWPIRIEQQFSALSLCTRWLGLISRSAFTSVSVGKPMKLSEAAEEVATFFAKMLDHEYTTKDIFRKNFFKDWRKATAHLIYRSICPVND